jgi:methylated-DNA-protein-cysteine methyltransferase related protein
MQRMSGYLYAAQRRRQTWRRCSSVMRHMVATPATIQQMARRASTDAQAAILRRVRTIPPGYVRTYGDVSPGAPRLAGYVLSRVDAHDIPWHRVVRADGSLAKGARQRCLLEAEAVPFHGERVVLSSARLDDLDAA